MYTRYNIIYTFVLTKDWCNRIFILYILYPRGTLTVNGATDDNNICKFCRKKICYIINNKYIIIFRFTFTKTIRFQTTVRMCYFILFIYFFNLNGFRSICFHKKYCVRILYENIGRRERYINVINVRFYIYIKKKNIFYFFYFFVL